MTLISAHFSEYIESEKKAARKPVRDSTTVFRNELIKDKKKKRKIMISATLHMIFSF